MHRIVIVVHLENDLARLDVDYLAAHQRISLFIQNAEVIEAGLGTQPGPAVVVAVVEPRFPALVVVRDVVEPDELRHRHILRLPLGGRRTKEDILLADGGIVGGLARQRAGPKWTGRTEQPRNQGDSRRRAAEPRDHIQFPQRWRNTR